MLLLQLEEVDLPDTFAVGDKLTYSYIRQKVKTKNVSSRIQA